MPIRFACPNCSKKINAPDQAAGRKVQCPACASAMIVPAAPAPAAIAVAPSRPPANSQDRDFSEPAPAAPAMHVHVHGPGAPTGNGMAVTGMVLGICAFVFSFVPCAGWVFAVILGILGAIFSGIGLSKAFQVQRGKGMAVTGLALSLLAMVWGPVFDFIVLAAIFGGSGGCSGVPTPASPQHPIPTPIINPVQPGPQH